MLALAHSQMGKNLGARLLLFWKRERFRPRPSLLRALWGVFWRRLLSLAALAFFAEALVGVGFYLLALIINSIITDARQHVWSLCAAFALSLLLLVFLRHNYMVQNSVLFLEIRQSLTALLYQKSLNLGLRSVAR